MKKIALIGTILALGISSAFAQTTQPEPSWKQGMKANTTKTTLAPQPGKLTVTPASQIPIDKLKLPPGFKIEIWSTGTPGVRAMTRSDSGKIYAGTRTLGRIYEITDHGTKRTSRVFIDKLNQPTPVMHKGSLYVMAVDKALRFDDVETHPDAKPVDMTALFKLPPLQHHNWKYLRFGPDDKLYVPFGAPCNICELPTNEYAQIRRYNADGTGMEVIATGIRNSVGFDWHPVTGELWFTNHGRDWMGDDTPDDGLFRLSKTGQNFGFPYCHLGTIPDPDIKKKNPCQGVTPAVLPMGPHAAVMGLQFYTGDMFPAEFKNTAFIARRGSWNRTQKNGYDVVTVHADADGKNASMKPFLTGFKDDKANTFWGRPAYLLQMPDGALLLSDEQTGAIYRISYEKP